MSSPFLRVSLAFGLAAVSAFACSSSDNNRVAPTTQDASSDAKADATHVATDHGLTLSSCDEDRIEKDQGNLVYRTIETAGGSRSFQLLRPENVKCTLKAPLVILVHGALPKATVTKNPGDYFANLLGYPDDASANGYILAAPHGLSVDGDFLLSADKENDMTFISDLIDAVTLKEPVNPKRVYVVGYGEGGAVALKAACDFSSRVSGVESVAGGLLKSTKAACTPSESVSIALASGSGDKVISPDGDDNYEPFQDAFDFLIGAMKCTDDETNTTDGDANITTHEKCDNSAQIRKLQVPNASHEKMTDWLQPLYSDFLKKRFKS